MTQDLSSESTIGYACNQCCLPNSLGFPGGSKGKNLPAMQETLGLIPGLGRFPWRREWQPTPVLLTGESHGQRNLAGYSPPGRRVRQTERLNKYQYQTKHPRLERQEQAQCATHSSAHGGRAEKYLIQFRTDILECVEAG